MQPRIYTYKVTFEEIPHWYWGVHKEKSYNDGYVGSPVTHRWVWDFYTPKIQILETFPFTEEGWKEAQLVEKRLISPDLNNPLCLNEAVGGIKSILAIQKGGITAGSLNARLRKGICDPAYFKSDRKIEQAIKNGKTSFERKVGCHSPEFLKSEKRRLTSQKAGLRNVELGLGFCSDEARRKSKIALSKPLRCVTPSGQVFLFSSAREAERMLSISQATISQAAARGTVIKQGKAKGFFFEMDFTLRKFD
jgi:hypothetical protein